MQPTGLIYPRPKSYESLPGHWLLSRAATVAADSAAGRRAAELLAEDLAALTGRTTPPRVRADAIRVRLQPRVAGLAGRAEGYALDVRPDGVDLAAPSEAGLRHAGQTLLGLLRRGEDGLLLAPCCRVRDWPDFPVRGFLLNAATTFADMKEVEWQIDLLARNKMNLLHMNFVDAVSFTLPTRRWPKLNVPPDPRRNGVYSRDDLRRMVAHGARRGVDILPTINVPGHMAYWMKQYPTLRCGGPRPSPWVMCLGRERGFDMIESLLDELLPLLPYRWVHIGTDELEFEDALERVWLSWRECPHCLRRMEREGLAGVRELFYYFVRRLHAMLAARGKGLMMWNDNVDSSRPVDLPGDIRMHFWRIPRPGRGPHAGCSLNRLAARGFDVVCSPFAETYVDSFARDERLLAWTPGLRPPVRADMRRRLLGGIGCSWRGGGKYPPEYYAPPFLAVLGDRLWNRAPVRDADAFARGLARHLFGPAAPPALAQLFHLDGRIIHNEAGRFDGAPGLLKPLPPAAAHRAAGEIEAALRQCLRAGWDRPTARAFLAQCRRA
jgi:N-acetyl-beta-hexosaminidase